MSEIFEPDDRKIKPFLIITFVFSWLFWLPNLLYSIGLIDHILIYDTLMFFGSFGPSLAGLSLTIYYKGREGLKDLWKRT